MYIPSKTLDTLKPKFDNSRTKIYFLDAETMIKRFSFADHNDQLAKADRYLYATQNIQGLSNVSLPFDFLETENGFEGYIERILPGTLEKKLTTFSDFYNSNRDSLTLAQVTEYILKCCDIVNDCHQNDIVNPDMSTDGNVLFNPINGDVYFTDYQDMQVGKIPSSAISTFIMADPTITRSKKYFDGDYFDPNIDWYTLAIRYFYYITKINLPMAIASKYDINLLINMSGLSGTEFANYLRNLHNRYTPNLDIRSAITELSENYEMSPFIKGQARKLVPKK